MHLYLIRHGESFTNLNHKHATKPEEHDSGLTPRGKVQAKAAAEWIKENIATPDTMFVSTMQRTQETAQFIADAYGLPITLDDRLREMSCNYPDGSPIPRDRFAMKWREFTLMDEGFGPIAINDFGEETESYADVKVRIGRFLEDTIETHRDKMVFGVIHGGILNAFVDVIFNLGTYRRVDVRPNYTAISHFEYTYGEGFSPWYVHYMAQASHLIGVDEG